MTSELVNRKAVQHNDLITSMAKMSKNALKIFELAVSCIDVNAPPKDNVVRISKQTVFDFMKNIQSNSRQHELRESLTTLHKQSVFEVKDLRDDGRMDYKLISPIASSSWNDYDDSLQIEFTDAIMPYLIELKVNFTQYAIMDLIDLNSKYSIILYKWLSMNFNQYEKYRLSQRRTAEQLEKLKNPIIQIEELRRITNTAKDYDRIFDLEKRVLQVAQAEINAHTHLTVEYEKVRSGRKVIGFRFLIENKPERAELPYKEGDPFKEMSKDEKEKERITLFTQAIQSPYTTLLLECWFLQMKDMQDMDLLASLQQNVYPLYDTLKEKRGLDGVKEHVQYVANHKEGVMPQKENLTKYLHKAITGYLQTVALQDTTRE